MLRTCAGETTFCRPLAEAEEVLAQLHLFTKQKETIRRRIKNLNIVMYDEMSTLPNSKTTDLLIHLQNWLNDHDTSPDHVMPYLSKTQLCTSTASEMGTWPALNSRCSGARLRLAQIGHDMVWGQVVVNQPVLEVTEEVWGFAIWRGGHLVLHEQIEVVDASPDSLSFDLH